MTAQDIRVGRWDLHATAGDEPSIIQTWLDANGLAFSLVGRTVRLYLRSVSEHVVGYATSAINTATSKNLVLYVTHSVSNASVATRFYAGSLQLLKGS